MRVLALRSILVVAFTALMHQTSFAAPRNTNPDWPCQQRLVPTLSAGLFWSGPRIEEAGNWHQEPEIAALVKKITQRRVTTEQGEALIRQFAQGLTVERPRILTLVFAGLLDETNRQRGEIIDRIKAFARRQRELADIAVRVGDDLNSIPPDATGADAARRQELEQRRFYVVKAFEDAKRTLRYSCEVPVNLEARLGAYARTLQEKLS